MSQFRRRIRRACSIGAAVSLMLCLAPGAWAQDGAGKLSARPQLNGSGQQAAGVTRLSYAAIAYRPPKAPPGPLPLLVLFHGASGDSRRFLELFRTLADERGLQLLALQSKGSTWDVIRRREPPATEDLRRIDSVLREYFRDAAVDPRRIMVSGFSDGASYALSLGLANPELFPSVIALSPGLVIIPERMDGSQRVFIAHGKGDHILPFQKTARIADRLSSGVQVRFRRFDGDHEIDRKALSEGLDFALEVKP